jgi:transposase
VKRIAIERPDGDLIERLLEAGLVVLPIHPNQLKAARPRFRTSGGKSDSFDAFSPAELARTDNLRFRVLVPDSDETKALRALTRAREDLVKTKVSLTNRLQAELAAFWTGAAMIFRRLDSPIALAFLERYPSPTDARALGEKRLSSFLTRHGYCGGKAAAELLAKLRPAPKGRTQQTEGRHAGLPCLRCLPHCTRSSSRSGCSNFESPMAFASIPTARSSSRSFATLVRR